MGAVVLGIAAVACLLALSQRRDFHEACVPPRSVDTLGPRVYDNHKAITVSRGEIITVQLSTGASGGWPWGVPHSSDESVLKPVPLCFDPTNVSSLPVQLTPFRATAPGLAVIRADAYADPAGPFTVTVTVIR
jgi:hypothetical protein